MFMPRVSYNWGIFDFFSSGICLGLHVTETDIFLCLSLKSIETIILLRVKKKSQHCSSSLREQWPFFSLPFSNASVIEEHQCSFVVVSLQNTEVPSLLHHRSTVAQASSIVVVVVEVAEPPLSPFNLACRYVFLLFLIIKPFYVSNAWFGSRWFSCWWFHVFCSDMVVKRGCSATSTRWMEASWSCSGVM